MSAKAKKIKSQKRNNERFVMPLNLPIQIRWDHGRMQTTAVILDLSHDGIKIYTSYDFTGIKNLDVVTLKGNLSFEIIQVNKQDDFAFNIGLRLISEDLTIEDVFSSYIQKSINSME